MHDDRDKMPVFVVGFLLGIAFLSVMQMLRFMFQ